MIGRKRMWVIVGIGVVSLVLLLLTLGLFVEVLRGPQQCQVVNVYNGCCGGSGVVGPTSRNIKGKARVSPPPCPLQSPVPGVEKPSEQVPEPAPLASTALGLGLVAAAMWRDR